MTTAIGRIGVVSYGVGNVTSVCNSLARVGAAFGLVETPADAAEYPKLLLPGVGAFAPAAARLRSQSLDAAIRDRVQSGGAQVLGVCLGMQLLFESSTENGVHAGVGLLPGVVESLADGQPDLQVPHMGWNNVQPQAGSRLLPGCGDAPDFYFVHSFACFSRERSIVAGTCTYGRTFDAVVEAGPIMGCQFHPEKSQAFGLQVLRNFAELPC